MAQEAWEKNSATLKPLMRPIAPSRSWYQSFLKRHPSLRTAMGQKIEKLRHDNATNANITFWFENTLIPLYAKHNYNPEMVANCDETMVHMNGKKGHRIVLPKENGSRQIVTEADVPHITFLSTIFADGAFAKTLIIYPKKTLPQELSLETIAGPNNYVIAGQSGGWIDLIGFSNYCTTVLIPTFLTQRSKVKKGSTRGLLVLDGHSSRWNSNLMEEFGRNGIDVVTLHAHTSHVCQPLDALVFGEFKTYLSQGLKIATGELKRVLQDEPSFGAVLAVEVPETASVNLSMYSESYEDGIPPENILDFPDPEPQLVEQGQQLLNLVQRRFILIHTAKYCLHMALYESVIRESFRTTGVYPLSLETCLKRSGVRHTGSLDDLEVGLRNSKKRKRVSINGIILTSEEALAMLKTEKEKKSETQAPPAKRGRPRKNPQ